MGETSRWQESCSLNRRAGRPVSLSTGSRLARLYERKGVRVKRLGNALLLASALVALTACSPPPPATVWVKVAPPPPEVEFLTPAPAAGFVWVRGYHAWDGNTYVWVPGAWRYPPRPHAAWKPGHWRHGRHGWYWVEGRWK